MQMQDPYIKSASQDLLSFLDDPETYMPHEPSKPKEDFSKVMFKQHRTKPKTDLLNHSKPKRNLMEFTDNCQFE